MPTYTPAAPWNGPYPQEVTDDFGNSWEAYGPNQLKKPSIAIEQPDDCCLYTTEVNVAIEGFNPSAFAPSGKSAGDTYLVCHTDGLSMWSCDGAAWVPEWIKPAGGTVLDCNGDALTGEDRVFTVKNKEDLGVGLFMKWVSSDEDPCVPVDPPKPELCWMTIREDGIPLEWPAGGPWKELTVRPQGSNSEVANYNFLNDLLAVDQGSEAIVLEHCSNTRENIYDCLLARFVYQATVSQIWFNNVSPDWRIRFDVDAKFYKDGQLINTTSGVRQFTLDTRGNTQDTETTFNLEILPTAFLNFEPPGTTGQVCLCLNAQVINKGTSIATAQVGSFNLGVSSSTESN